MIFPPVSTLLVGLMLMMMTNVARNVWCYKAQCERKGELVMTDIRAGCEKLHFDNRYH